VTEFQFLTSVIITALTVMVELVEFLTYFPEKLGTFLCCAEIITFRTSWYGTQLWETVYLGTVCFSILIILFD
jgi:hypothetical protein